MVKYYDEMSSKEFEEKVDEGTIVILPIGIIEEHGDHLPLCTDSIQAEHIVERLAERFDAIVAPPLRYGNCSSTKNFPGSVSISFDTMREFLYEVLSEFVRNGLRKLVVISGHAGSAHMCALREAAKEVVEEADEEGMDVKAIVLSDYEMLYKHAGKDFDADDGHGGTMETSRVMQLRGDLVKGRGRDAQDWPPPFFILAHPEKDFPTGIKGYPSKASKELGRKLEDIAFAEISALIERL